jgi:subtilisin family serine protease
MRLKMLIGAGTVALAMVLGTGSAHAVPAPAKAPAKRIGPHTVTLVTGDRLTVDGPGRVTVKPRKGISYLTRTVHGHLSVIPSDALGLLDAGKLDPRLFDVTTLIWFGYDDRRADLPLIVTYTGGAGGRAATRATLGATAGRDLFAVNGVAVKEAKRDAGTFWAGIAGSRPGRAALTGQIAKVWLDGKRKPTLDVSVPLIGAPQAWQAGFTGAGVRVAVVDTGIDATHPDLAGKVVAEQNFTGDGDPLDRVGHGTHVASTIAGSGAASNGRYKGVAPDAKLSDAKVCVLEGCDDSWIIAGMQWAAADQHAKVVNMSLGGPDTPDVDPLEQAVANLTAQYGTLFVIAAGNDGGDGTIESPGSADDAVSVGAVTKTEDLADFSSRGPRVGDYALKPDITAPGVDITAARGKDGIFGNPGDLYTTLSGTSMATPHVAGSAAILAQAHPAWTPAQLKAGLMAAAKPNPAINVYAQGAGRVDIGRGVRQPVTTSPVSLSYGLAKWPHSDDQPVTKTVTYHNFGTAPLTLSLALHTNAPAGFFAVSANQVTVPAGGDASVDVTADTRGGATGLFGGQLTATAGEVVVQTPLAVDSEVESYDLRLSHLDRTGAAPPLYDTALVRLDQPGFYDISAPGATTTIRLPKGRYLLYSVIFSGVGPAQTLSLLTQPVLDVARDQSLTLDARVAKPVSVSIPAKDATQLIANIGFSQQIGEFGFSSLIIGQDFTGLYSAQVGPNTVTPGFTGLVSGQWGRTQPDGSLANSPYAYLLSYFQKGRMYTGFQRTVAPRDLATVHVDFAHEATGATGGMIGFGDLPGGQGGGFSTEFPGDLPGSRVEYVNGDDGVQWTFLFTQEVPSTDPQDPFPAILSFAIGTPTAYQPGHTYRESWNQGPFSPVFPPRPFPEAWVTRSGDTLNVLPPLFGDNAGREGVSILDSATTTLSKDGKVILTQPDVSGLLPVPADPGTYRLQLDYTRGAPFTLSTKGSVAWTFTSKHVTGDKPLPLPLSVVRFLPRLDQQNTADGNLCVIPVQVLRQPDSTAGRTSGLTVQVSYDDGAHWVPALLLRLGNGGLAFARHPAGHGYVSLHATQVDTAGNSVEQTLIRAYAF